MENEKEALRFLESEIEKMGKKTILSFEEYLELVKREPQRVLRNIFQLFYDMVKNYVGEGVDEYPDDPESIGFVKYDCSELFVKKADNPFFADRLFANRFIRQVESLRQGFQQNRIYVYEGPSGCGKSTFLNNLLKTLEAYTNTEQGQSFEIIWEIDGDLSFHGPNNEDENPQNLIIPCPSHDYPILVIPKNYRAGFIERLLPKEKNEELEIKSKIFGEKDYEWLFNGEVCTICKSIFWSLLCMLGSVDKVLSMVKVRPHKFDRSLGEGISIFNPGDKPIWGVVDGKPVGGNFTNKNIQERLEKIFGPNAVRYVFSPLAKTNNGIYVLMDIKAHNRERLLELHNVISEGVHKVGDVEEPINSLFFALMNPEDKEVIKEEKMESFEGRIHYNKIPYVLEPSVEVNIYRNIFGEQVNGSFLPRVLGNFAKVIIASRMNPDCKPLKEWIPDIAKYKKFCDENGLLLRMKIYGGVIPEWLWEEDKRKFTAPIRRAMIAEGENDGNRGFSGRDSIKFFGEFFSRYSGRTNLINMANVAEFFKHKIGRERRDDCIPKNFLASLVDLYDYTVLNEMKEALYFYNKERVSRDILNYLWAVNYDIGSKIKSQYTGEEIEVTIDFLKQIGAVITGKEMKDQEVLNLARDIQKEYVIVIAKERSDITETELYRKLHSSYARNLKEKALQPFIGNVNFREAIKSFGAKAFETFDTRLKEHVSYMIKNLIENFGYTEQGAKEICLYVIDKELHKKFH